jgi:hypothetical protein
MILELLKGGEGAGPDTAQGTTPETGAAPDSGEGGALATDQPPAPGGAPVTPPTAGGAAEEPEAQDNPQEEGAEPADQPSQDGSSVGPVHGIAKAAEMVFTRVAQAVEQAGDKLNPDVALHAGIEIFNLLAEMSEKAGIKDYSQDKNSAEAAFFEAIDSVVEKAKQSGEVDERQAATDMERLIQADHDGLLAELMQKLAAQDGEGAASHRGRSRRRRCSAAAWGSKWAGSASFSAARCRVGATRR